MMTTLDWRSRARSPRTEAAGFTLIELMITVVVLAILVAIALPTYKSEVEKSRRTDAKTAVLDLAAREQRFFSVNNTFSQSPQDLGYGPAGSTFPMNVGSNYYSVNVTATAVPPNPPTFSVKATAINSQTADTQCQSFTVDNAGRQTASDSSNADTTATCWQ